MSSFQVVVLVVCSDGTLEYHFCKLKPPFLNTPSHFCLKITTCSTGLPPDVKLSTYTTSDMFSITLVNSLNNYGNFYPMKKQNISLTFSYSFLLEGLSNITA